MSCFHCEHFLICHVRIVFSDLFNKVNIEKDKEEKITTKLFNIIAEECKYFKQEVR